MTASSAPEQIKKRDGRVVAFDREKIVSAILKATSAVHGGDRPEAEALAARVVATLEGASPRELPTVERIQDAIEKVLIDEGQARSARAFILYRGRRSRIREAKTELMDAVEEILAEVEKGEPAVASSPSEKLLRIGATASKEFYLKRLLPEEMADAHLRGDLHIQDLEHYAKAPNSFVIPLDRLLAEGYRTPHGRVRAPKRAHSAASVAALALQAAQSDCFGGQVFDRFDTALSLALPAETTDHELGQAMEGLIYNLNMLHSRNGGQVPYSTLTFGADPSPMARRVARALLDAYEAGLGRGEPAVYPNLVFLHRSGLNATEGDPNFDLLHRALEVASTRMQPTFAFLDAPFNRDEGGAVTYLSGCARIGFDRFGHLDTAGRGAIATVTLNLVRAALRARRDGLAFEALLERQAKLAIRTLHHRYEVLSTLKAHELPFLMGEGLYAEAEGLDAQEAIAKALRHGHLALGFIGLAEALKVLEGAHHGESAAAQDRGLGVVSLLRRLVDEASEELDLNVVLYAQQAERTAGRFPMLDQGDFGRVAGVTDKGYYTSAFSLPADCAVSAANKIALEAPYHALCNGGHLTSIAFDAPVQDASALGALVARMNEAGLGHGAVSFPVDHCASCGHSGVIPADCPECRAASGTIRRVRRVAGYLESLDRVHPGKLAELAVLATHCDGSL
ncbi:MAG TPA: anaerobic ribonucleoside-triphosphate reductase [Pantanalinema sp.]